MTRCRACIVDVIQITSEELNMEITGPDVQGARKHVEYRTAVDGTERRVVVILPPIGHGDVWSGSASDRTRR